MKVPRIHWILQIFCPELFTNRMTTPASNEENNPLGMDKNTATSLRSLKSIDV